MEVVWNKNRSREDGGTQELLKSEKGWVYVCVKLKMCWYIKTFEIVVKKYGVYREK